MPKFGSFKFAKERFGQVHHITPWGTFGTFKFGEHKFGAIPPGLEGKPFFKGMVLGARARKQLSKEIIFRVRYGHQEQYAWFKPANPQTEDQQANRARFETAVAAWKALTPKEKREWSVKALGTGIPGYNLFLRTEMLK